MGRRRRDNSAKLNVASETCNTVVPEPSRSPEHVLAALSTETIRHDFDLNTKSDLGTGVGKVLDS